MSTDLGPEVTSPQRPKDDRQTSQGVRINPPRTDDETWRRDEQQGRDRKPHPRDKPVSRRQLFAPLRRLIPAAGAVPAAVDATQTAIENLGTADPRLFFEPALHPLTDEEITADLARLNAGDLTVHAWNPEVTQRLMAIDPRPSSVLIDGLFVSRGNPDLLDADFTWYATPPFSQDTFVIAGDTDYMETLSTTPYGVTSEKGKAINDSLKTYRDSTEKIHTQEASDRLDREFKLFVGAFVGAIGLYATKKLLQGDAQSMPRREALRILGGTAAGLALFGLTETLRFAGQVQNPHEKAGFSLSEAQKNRWQQIENYVDRIPKDLWADGRTARAIEIQLYAMELLRQTQPDLVTKDSTGAIVMGYSHVNDETAFMKNKRKRSEAIRTLAEENLKVTLAAVKTQYTLTPAQEVQLSYDILRNFSSFRISRVTDPENRATQRDPNFSESADAFIGGMNARAYMQEHVKNVQVDGKTTLLCEPVWDIVKDLLPPSEMMQAAAPHN